MKKPLITFLAVFAIAFAIIATVNIKKIDTNIAIAHAPAFVVAKPDGITKRTKKSRVTYQVNFSYSIAGINYKMDSDWLDTVADAETLASSPVQIAYDSTKPENAVFRSDFDKRDPNEGTVSALISAGGLGLFLALLVTAVLLYKFPSLRSR
ncbi:hypothetical protein PO883_12130 [Massilia sp. DJPM01]|uniref:hypothetical protein n=1 Tax=Massilia sp. DJPM01 TaxID=3024404 RepID=UPI00259E90D1|nr:hypothetical protein [Massilia sp. DJPM01]MDM5177939.1 hypothetical protein [Massilia sp. DJPM01]